MQIAGDITNAFAYARPPLQPTYIAPDCAIKEYYLLKYGKEIPDRHILPLIGIL